ncbi:MAG: lysophospholipase L1-like esterase/pimeloyl-ACP methyl ester carboxylesterase [Candidatus Paceibacteria bacterium]|jgi:lysophospholipase L1-like esterase/pimeloyl-ACP methyl ester carboxylesterase
MKHWILSLKSWLCVLLLMAGTPPAMAAVAVETQPLIKVACLGDSITFGSGLPDRERTTYPIVLGTLLGEGHEVRNYGVSGATLLSKGDRPYVQQPAFEAALAWQPDVVVILLGTNDSKLHNWSTHGPEFTADYSTLVARLRELPSHPRIVLCAPVPAWVEGASIDSSRIAQAVVPAVRQVASSSGSELVDLYTSFVHRGAWFPDGVHPNPHGVEAIARRILETLEIEQDSSLDVESALANLGVEAEPADFHGYRGMSFQLDGMTCRVVQPRVAAKGAPWIWRARFWGHEPQFDLAMLERGWHVAYGEVGGLYGNSVAVARWSQLYEVLTEAGLSSKPLLEGMSRGGLIVYNWAREFPNQVAGIYADNPVCDARSWPGGAGKSQRRETEWQQCLAAYGLDEDQALRAMDFPIDGLKALADAGVPLLHVIGEADDVVPAAENSDVLEARYRELGGTIQVIRKPGLGHHPHSLPDPAPLVKFALRATGRGFNPCTRAQPSVEWRGSAAGWGGGTWWEQHENINALAQDSPDLRLVFLGDSITQSWTGSKDRLAHADGKRPFDRWYGRRKAASFGISGDRTEHLLFRVENGNFDGLEPAVIVLMIGVNNINTGGDDGEALAAGIKKVVESLRIKQPRSELILLGCFPTKQLNSWARRQSDLVHERIGSLGELEHVHYLDLRGLFLNSDGTLNPDTMRSDGVHITAAGYEAWAAAIEPLLKELLGETVSSKDD